ncbi:MAG: rhomboid family intramembrane serine protease [Thermoanaerobaculia bacterium]|nr:rhomboid family intramembrane serine protease [Thermoanaerobaculia bacterium]
MAAFRARGENLHAVYILLFLNIAFFFLEHQDAEKYARVFSFDWNGVMSGEAWRLFTWQFAQAGQGWFAFPKVVVLFFTLLLLYIMGSAVEEEWGTFHFLTLFAASTLVSALTAGWFGIPLLGSYFVNFSLLFVYAATFPEQTFYFFGVIPIKIRWIGWAAALVLISGVLAGGGANAAAFAGAVVSLGYYAMIRKPRVAKTAVPKPAIDSPDATAIRNAARFVAVKKAVASAAVADIDRLAAQFQREVVTGVNICPPADYKPENSDGYCIRCDGFAECSARYLKARRPPTDVPVVMPSATATENPPA